MTLKTSNIDDIFSLWGTRREQITHFIEQANNHHATIKFTSEISENKITFLDKIVYKGKRFNSTSILDAGIHFKPTETFHLRDYVSTLLLQTIIVNGDYVQKQVQKLSLL